MTTTITATSTFNRDDIRRVHASFAAEYRFAAEWTNLHSTAFVAETITEISWLAEEEYLGEIHLQLKSSIGTVREAVVYRVSTDASGWSCDRPSGPYWSALPGDSLMIVVSFSQKWWQLSEAERDRLTAAHLPGWGSGTADYGTMTSTEDRHFASRAYGLKRIRFSG